MPRDLNSIDLSVESDTAVQTADDQAIPLLNNDDSK